MAKALRIFQVYVSFKKRYTPRRLPGCWGRGGYVFALFFRWVAKKKKKIVLNSKKWLDISFKKR